MHIAIYTRPTNSYGVLVIVDNIIKVGLQRDIVCRHITSLADAKEDEVVLPYGTLETVEMIKAGKTPILSLLVDAISLGVSNKFRVYTKTLQIWNKDYIYSLLRIFKWGYLDRRIAKTVKNVMVVSETDGNYMKKMNKGLNVIVCPNGIAESAPRPHVPSNKLRLGILSSWNSIGSYQENNWFLRSYYPRFAKQNPDVELVIAGRGVYVERLRDLPQVHVMGEVENLSDFFSNIDYFLSVNPKGCGILNRCLDAFVHKVPVIGHMGSLTGFTYMKDAYLSFNNYNEFVLAINRLSNEEGLGARLVDNAYREVQSHNNWDKNIGYLLDQIKELSGQR